MAADRAAPAPSEQPPGAAGGRVAAPGGPGVDRDPGAARSWEVLGARSGGTWVCFGSPRDLRLRGHVAGVPVRLVEDPGGDYRGWLPRADRLPRPPVMVQHRRVFEVQFPDGSAAEAAAGRGEVVRLRVEVRDA